MRTLALLVLATLGASAETPAWNQDTLEKARAWFAAQPEAGTEVRHFQELTLKGDGAAEVGTQFRFFAAAGTDCQGRTVASRPDGSFSFWAGGDEGAKAVLRALAVNGTDEASMRGAAAAVLALPGEPGYEARRAEIRGRTLVYRAHQIDGFFSCGFMGSYTGDITFAFAADGSLESVARDGDPDLRFEEYRKLLRGGDPWLVDGVEGGKEMAERLDKRDKELDDLVARLDDEDAGKRDAAERELSRLGLGVEDRVKKAAESASPEKSARCKRILRWIAYQWTGDPAKEARAWYEGEIADFKVVSFEELELAEPAHSYVPSRFRFFRGEARDKHNVNARHDIVVIDRLGAARIWKGELSELVEVLDRCGLHGRDDSNLKLAGGVCVAIPSSAYDAKKHPAPDEGRMETRAKEFIYHHHRIWLGSGVLGGYLEDEVFAFDEAGRLSRIETTGIENFQIKDLERLLGEADPWLQLTGWVPDDMRDQLEAKQAKKERTPPRHEKIGK
ncbi:MAG: hypothetical protein HYY18_04420 [Planctomycetes bacterium]|nr:hypothetical protein [Planctomycetota bacterium]